MKFLRRHVLLIATLWILTLPGIMSYAISSIVSSRINDVRLGLVQGQVTNSCHRLNILRVEQTRNDLAVYRFFRVTAKDLQLSAKTQTGARKHGTLVFANMLASDAKQLSWTPLTNCITARSEGLAFRSPSPKFFNQELPRRENTTLGPQN